MDSSSGMTEIYELLGLTERKTLKELIDAQKVSLRIKSDRQLSSLLGINKDTLNRIINGESKKVDLISIIKISNFLDLNIEDTVKTYVSSLEVSDISDLEDNRKANFIVRNFDLDVLHKLGFITSKTDFTYIEKRIKSFFSISDVFDYNSLVAYPLFSKSKQSSDDLMNKFWLKSAYMQFEEINNPNEYSQEELQKLIPKIRPYSRLEDRGLLTVVKALYSAGVTVIVQKYISKTSVKGATFIVNGKPCVVITDYFDRYDLLWFTLFHELCHVLNDYDDIERNKYHLTGSNDLLLLNEERANYFARSLLFGDEKLKFIKPNIFNPLLVAKYAKENNVHPSIIYGFYLYDNRETEGAYKKLRHLLPSSELAVKELKLNVWDEESSLKEEIEKIKQKIQ